MPETGIPAEVQRFIVSHIKSLEQLEVLLLLVAQPGKHWTAEAVNAVVQSNVTSVAQRLSELCQAGFLIRSDQPEIAYQYQPFSPEHSGLIAEIAKAYRERRIRVVELIYGEGTDPARRFADAFRLKKKP